MKKLSFVIVLLAAALIVYSQDSEGEKNKSSKSERIAKRAAKKSELDRVFANYSKDRITVDLNGTNWLYNPASAGMNNMRTKWHSRGFNVYFSWDFRFKGSRVSIAPGIGYSNSNIYLGYLKSAGGYERSSMIQDSTGAYSFMPLSYQSDTTVKTSKLELQFIDIPIELRIRSNPDKLNNMWKVAIGVKFGLRISAHTKVSLKEGNNTKVYIERRFPNFSTFRFGPTLRVGYSFFNITAYYGVINVFKNGLGPKANEFSLGISFTGL